jgi:hypothetical protein
MPADQWLTEDENATKWAIVSRIEQLGYTTEVFFDPRGTTSISASQAWTASECEDVMRHCDGCALLGFPRWRLTQDGQPFWLPTDFNHYEGALAHTMHLPLLVLVQDGVEPRGVFDRSYKGYIGKIPKLPTPAWLDTNGFEVPFKYFRQHLSARRDVFLGYSSTSSGTAAQIRNHLIRDLNLTVLDWALYFDAATTILSQIEEASKRCGAGIFLFTKDDSLADGNGDESAVPRDNVVFEAGYFIAQKGKSRVLIVLQKGAKMPADLGGDIYASLSDKADIQPIHTILRKFGEAL